MADIANTRALQQCIAIVEAAATWEREAKLLGTAEYAGLMEGLAALAEAVDMLTPALPQELQP